MRFIIYLICLIVISCNHFTIKNQDKILNVDSINAISFKIKSKLDNSDKIEFYFPSKSKGGNSKYLHVVLNDSIGLDNYYSSSLSPTNANSEESYNLYVKKKFNNNKYMSDKYVLSIVKYYNKIGIEEIVDNGIFCQVSTSYVLDKTRYGFIYFYNKPDSMTILQLNINRKRPITAIDSITYYFECHPKLTQE